MAPLRLLWLALTVAGALPFAARLLHQGGWWPVGWEAGLASLTLTCFVLSETYVRKNWEALLAIPATWLIGPACGLPLYLFLRAGPIR